MKFRTRLTAMTVVPENEPSYAELATRVEIESDGAGEYVIIKQDTGSISVGPEEWPALRGAINRLMRLCESDK